MHISIKFCLDKTFFITSRSIHVVLIGFQYIFVSFRILVYFVSLRILVYFVAFRNISFRFVSFVAFRFRFVVQYNPSKDQLVPGGSMSQVVGSNNSYKPITDTARVRARLCKLQKGCTRLAAANDKVYQLLAHGRWFSPGTPASSTTKTGRHDIHVAETLLKVS